MWRHVIGLVIIGKLANFFFKFGDGEDPERFSQTLRRRSHRC